MDPRNPPAPDNLRKRLENCIDIALAAGEKVMEIYNADFSVILKQDQSPLTEADLAANRIICDGLEAHFPGECILSEETADDYSARHKHNLVWIIDPIDGTKEFIKKNGEFTVNIGLVYRGKPILGVVYAPALGELYYGARGEGSYFDNVSEKGKAIPIHVSARTENLVAFRSRSHASRAHGYLIDHIQPRLKNMVPKGSSLKGCLIARGVGDVYYRFGKTMEWDTAAVHCVVTEAGGTVRQIDGSEITYNKEDPANANGFCVLNRPENYFRDQIRPELDAE